MAGNQCDGTPNDLRPHGLGLDYGRVSLVVDDEREWPVAFARLAAVLREALGELAVAVEHVGSTAVPGLEAKPILDVAVGLSDNAQVKHVRRCLETAGFEYRGDKGDDGGLLSVLENGPLHRVAHVHVVRYDDRVWRRYLRFRDRLSSDAQARASYASLKQALAKAHPDDRAAYTAGKASFISRLLGEVSEP